MATISSQITLKKGESKMKKLLFWACLAAFLFLYPLAYAQVDTLTILHVNDTHSHLLPYGPKDADGNWTWGGMARIASLVGMTRMTAPNVMLLHSGDLFVGEFMFQEYLGIAELEIMKALGYDALELGNHEFDLYPSTLEYVLNQAGFPANGFPVLCANLDLTNEPALQNFVTPYIIKDYGSVRVGIFGLLTDLTNQISNPSTVTVLPPLSVAPAWVDSLRSGHNCDIVVLVSHMGIDYEQMAAATISGIDIIVGGHTHTVLPQPLQIGNTLIVSAGEFGRYLGKLSVILNNGAIQNWSYDLISVDQTVPEEPTLAGMISNLAAGVEVDPRFGPVYTQVLAQANTELTKPLGTGLVKDNALGNMVADAFRAIGGTDIAFQPQGFDSQTIYAGAVKGADIFQAVPYGFDQTSGLGLKLVTFETNGMSIIAGLEFSVYNLPYVEDFFLHTSNMSYAYDSSNPPGSRVDYATIKVNGYPLDPAATYTVTTSDGVVPFLTQIPGFQVNNLTFTDHFVYTVVKDFMIAHSPVSYYAEARVLDLAQTSDPLVGVPALSDVIWLFRQNGSINRQLVANMLQHHLDNVLTQLQRGRERAAILGLQIFKLQVRVEMMLRHIAPFAGQRLLFLTDTLIQSIRASIGLASVGEPTDELPQEFALSQNYPNPFNPQTEISYSLPYDTNVRLAIYDILGQEVRILIDGYQSAGENTVVWDGRNQNGQAVSSGIYFYKLQAGDFVDTKKMSLVR
jgi:5'-nucleotidase